MQPIRVAERFSLEGRLRDVRNWQFARKWAKARSAIHVNDAAAEGTLTKGEISNELRQGGSGSRSIAIT